MNRTDREQLRERRNAQKAYAVSLKLKEKQDKEFSVYKAENAIAKNNKTKSLLDKFNKEHNIFWTAIESKSPSLLANEYITVLSCLEKLPYYRHITDWKPKGKGKESLFNSLCNHLFAKYPTPQFLWSGFWNINTNPIEESPIIKAIIQIASGGSFPKMCKSGEFPVQLTNKQCHEFLQSKSDLSFIKAIRLVQINTYKGNTRLLNTILKNRHCCQINDIRKEKFLDSVIAWFAKNPMLDLNQFEPLMDYIWYRWNADHTFSMKGRSPLAIIELMHIWHNDLSKKKNNSYKEYKPSGLKPGCFEYKYRDSSGAYIIDAYEITEILNSKELQLEGKEQHHCVLSYSWSIESGFCSIWSMKLNYQKTITIEVRNNKIVQARGKCNRAISTAEFKVLNLWAQQNSLGISL